MTFIIEILVNIAAVYLLIGLIFAIIFVLRGAVKIDPNVQGTSFLFRLMLIPGATLLWPVMLKKWIKASKT